jgi:hypothetical protein
MDYTNAPLSTLLPVAARDFLSYDERSQSVSSGVATAVQVAGEPAISDAVTMYQIDGFRDVVDIVKLQNVIFRVREIFEGEGWVGAPLIPDAQPTGALSARKPKDARSAIGALVDALALDAILSDPEAVKGTITADIDSRNPKRLNAGFTALLSGNTGIISVDLNFGFTFS